MISNGAWLLTRLDDRSPSRLPGPRPSLQAATKKDPLGGDAQTNARCGQGPHKRLPLGSRVAAATRRGGCEQIRLSG